MLRFFYIFLVVFSFTQVSAQLLKPHYAGKASWLHSTYKTKPEILAVSEKKIRFTVTDIPQTKSPVNKRKINPHSKIIYQGIIKSDLHPIHFLPIKLSPPESLTAAPLQTRDHAGFNVSYTDKQHGFEGVGTSDFAEDKEHNIWIASGNRLIRYDGVHYFVYSMQTGLPDDEINSIHIDNESRLWVGTANGVYFLKHDTLFTLQSEAIDKRQMQVNKITGDNHGRIWLATKEHGAFAIESGGIRAYNKRSGLPADNIESVFTASNGNILMGLRDGMIVIGNNRIEHLFSNSNHLLLGILSRFYEDEEGIWIGGFFAGLIKLGKKDTIQYTFDGTYKERIYDIVKGPDGIWMSIYGKGLCYFNKTDFLRIDEHNGLVGNASFSLLKDSFGNIWVSDLSDGFSRLNENTFYTRPFPYPNYYNPENLLTDKNGGKWVFTSGAGLFYEKNNRLSLYDYTYRNGIKPLNMPMDGTIDNNNSLWIGSYGAGLARVKDKEVSLFEYGSMTEHHVVLSVKKDADDNIWFRTMNFGLISYHNNRFFHYTQDQGILNNFSEGLFNDQKGNLYCAYNNGLQKIEINGTDQLMLNDQPYKQKVNCFFSSKKNTTLLATESAGLLVIKNDSVYQYTKNEGLLSNNIHSIVEDGQNRIWLTSDKGIESFELKDYRISAYRVFNQSNGAYITKAGPAFINENGLPYWSMGNAQLVYAPSFQTKSKKEPAFSAFDISIDGKKNIEQESISILPDEKISIGFTAIYWGRENNLKLTCMLVSSRGDTSIRYTENRSNLLLSEINPGKYHVFLQAVDNEHAFYSSPLTVTVRNFWYNTLLFRSSIAGLLLILTLLYFRRKGKKQELINQMLTQKVREQTAEILLEKEALLKSNKIIDRQIHEKDALIQEINHRVKNNLMFIAAIVRMQMKSENQKNTTESLQEISRRLNAMSLVHEMLFYKDNNQGLSIRKYIIELVDHLKAMTLNHSNPVTFNIEAEDILMDSKTAIALGMIISELVSNSLKHAFINIPHPVIEIILKRNDHLIQLQVGDNGIGINENESLKTGLGKRLVDIFSRQLEGIYTFETTEHFRFILEFPFEK